MLQSSLPPLNSSLMLLISFRHILEGGLEVIVPLGRQLSVSFVPPSISDFSTKRSHVGAPATPRPGGRTTIRLERDSLVKPQTFGVS